MATTLVPTVRERLARCGDRVFVDGLSTGADVVLSVDGVDFPQTASGGATVFAVPPLAAGAVVRARQDEGAGFTPWSPEVIVEDASVPPQSTPVLPSGVGACSQCVNVSHMVPGCRLELRVGQHVVGQGTANNQGDACVAVNLRRFSGEPGSVLLARMIVCGASGPDAGRILAADPALPQPTVGSPIFGCQSVVPVSNLRRGARCRFQTDTGTDLGSFCSCWDAVNVFVVKPLVVGELVRAQCYWDAKPCDAVGPWSDWQVVVPPDQGIKPTVLEVLVEGDQVLRVDNQIASATLLIRISPAEGRPAEEFGPRPASSEPEIALNAPLAAGNVVSVVQTLCGVSFESDPVVVEPRPPDVMAPVIVPPLFACARSAQVSHLHAGAVVRLFADSVPIGLAWCGESSSISVVAAPLLVAGQKVTVRQRVGASTVRNRIRSSCNRSMPYARRGSSSRSRLATRACG